MIRNDTNMTRRHLDIIRSRNENTTINDFNETTPKYETFKNTKN